MNIEALRAHNEKVREHIHSISVIKAGLSEGDYYTAFEAFAEIPRDDITTLWLAPTKGGIFTTEEREQMKSDEWAEARKQFAADLDKEAAANE